MPDLKQRAAFELTCDRGSLELTALDDDGYDVGVKGCDKRLVYQYVQTAEDHYDWTSHAQPKATEVQRPDAPGETEDYLNGFGRN